MLAKSKRVFIFKSYYPLHNLYFQVLTKLVDQIKLEMIELYIQNQNIIEEKQDLSIIDSDAQLGIINNKVDDEIVKLVNKVGIPPKALDEMEFDVFEQVFEYKLPDLLNLSYLDSNHCCPTLLKSISYENFIFLYLSLLHEKSLILISENLNKVSTSM